METTQPHARAEKILYIFGAATLRDLNAFLEQVSIDSPERKAESRAAWRGSAARFLDIQQSDDVPELIRTRPLAPSAQAVAQEIEGDVAFRQTFSNFPYSFEEVEIARLIATQRRLHPAGALTNLSTASSSGPGPPPARSYFRWLAILQLIRPEYRGA